VAPPLRPTWWIIWVGGSQSSLVQVWWSSPRRSRLLASPYRCSLEPGRQELVVHRVTTVTLSTDSWSVLVWYWLWPLLPSLSVRLHTLPTVLKQLHCSTHYGEFLCWFHDNISIMLPSGTSGVLCKVFGINSIFIRADQLLLHSAAWTVSFIRPSKIWKLTPLPDLWHLCYPHQLGVENSIRISSLPICDPNLVDLVCPWVSTLACWQWEVSVPLFETWRV
jgi:hypothetical protein